MKFSKTHRLDLFNRFESYGTSSSSFHFIKRKGRVITQHRDSKDEFSYFLRKSKDLQDTTFFEVKYHNDFFKVEIWPEVLKHFDVWLKSLDGQL